MTNKSMEPEDKLLNLFRKYADQVKKEQTANQVYTPPQHSYYSRSSTNSENCSRWKRLWLKIKNPVVTIRQRTGLAIVVCALGSLVGWTSYEFDALHKKYNHLLKYTNELRQKVDTRTVGFDLYDTLPELPNQSGVGTNFMDWKICEPEQACDETPTARQL